MKEILIWLTRRYDPKNNHLFFLRFNPTKFPQFHMLTCDPLEVYLVSLLESNNHSPVTVSDKP